METVLISNIAIFTSTSFEDQNCSLAYILQGPMLQTQTQGETKSDYCNLHENMKLVFTNEETSRSTGGILKRIDFRENLKKKWQTKETAQTLRKQQSLRVTQQQNKQWTMLKPFMASESQRRQKSLLIISQVHFYKCPSGDQLKG